MSFVTNSFYVGVIITVCRIAIRQHLRRKCMRYLSLPSLPLQEGGRSVLLCSATCTAPFTRRLKLAFCSARQVCSEWHST